MQSRGSSRLTVRQGPVPGKVFELVKDVVTVGRDVSNDLVINDAEVSRNHARLTAQSGGYLIEDLASTNGTFVNGQRLIGPKLLNPGDVVGLGETVVLEYGMVADAGATVVAAPPPAPATAEEFPTTPPRVMEEEPVPEPPPPPTMAEAMPAPEPAMDYQPAPEPPPAPPPAPAPKRDNRLLWIGGGCGCLTLCACAAILAYFVPWSDILGSLGF